MYSKHNILLVYLGILLISLALHSQAIQQANNISGIIQVESSDGKYRGSIGNIGCTNGGLVDPSQWRKSVQSACQEAQSTSENSPGCPQALDILDPGSCQGDSNCFLISAIYMDESKGYVVGPAVAATCSKVFNVLIQSCGHQGGQAEVTWHTGKRVSSKGEISLSIHSSGNPSCFDNIRPGGCAACANTS